MQDVPSFRQESRGWAMLKSHPTLVPHRHHTGNILVLGRIYSPIHGLSEGPRVGTNLGVVLSYLGSEGKGMEDRGLSSEQACPELMWCCDFSPSQAKSAPSLSSPS